VDSAFHIPGWSSPQNIVGLDGTPSGVLPPFVCWKFIKESSRDHHTRIIESQKMSSSDDNAGTLPMSERLTPHRSQRTRRIINRTPTQSASDNDATPTAGQLTHSGDNSDEEVPRLRLQMENEELALRMAKLRREKEDTQQSDHSGDADFDADDGELKIPALPPIDYSTEEFSPESNNAAGGERDGEEEHKEGNTDVRDREKCNYPVCVFEGGGPPLDTCQGSCGRLNKFHHACNVNWLESNGKDAELRKLCYICVQKI